MLRQFIFLAILLPSITAIAETIEMRPGSTITLNPRTEATIKCLKADSGGAARICICKRDDNNLNSRSFIQGVQQVVSGGIVFKETILPGTTDYVDSTNAEVAMKSCLRKVQKLTNLCDY